jgi:hypothetical protein
MPLAALCRLAVRRVLSATTCLASGILRKSY